MSNEQLRTVVKSYLACSINDITLVLHVITLNSFRESAFDGRVVVLYEVVLDELNDERRLSCGGEKC